MGDIPSLGAVPAKTILARNKHTGWFGCEYNMNLYRGCCHGCIYCDSRSDCYQVGNFDQVRLKQDALRILRDELARKMVAGVVATGAMSDPYNPYEREAQATRGALQLLHAYGYGSAIATKSDLILRDADVLQDIAAQSPVLLKITITTADDALAQKVEPYAPSSSRRFAALESLSKQGLFCGVLLMPVLPFLEDSDLNVAEIVHRAAAAGARFIYPSFGMSMRAGQREYYLEQLEQRFPGENLPKRYLSRYGMKYSCSSPRAKALWAFFQEEMAKTGMLYHMNDIVRAYRQGYGATQLSIL